MKILSTQILIPTLNFTVIRARCLGIVALRILCLLLCLFLGLHFVPPLSAQQPPSSDVDILSEELLKDIVPKDAAESLDSQDSNMKDGAKTGRSFGAGENPLEVISLGMLTASKYLREGQTGNTTQDVQSNVLMRLDELIDQTEKQSKKPKSSQSSAASQRSSKRQMPRPSQPKNADKQRSTQPNKSEGGQESEEDQGEQQRSNSAADNDTADSGVPRGDGSQAPDGSNASKAELGAAKALQQGVWGHLPERIRQQMMSRMVERFLPEYEASIEEYFRKLSDSEEDSKKP